MFQRILLAVDPSAAPARTLETVAALAKGFDSVVHVLHIEPTLLSATSMVTVEEDGDAQRVLQEAVDALLSVGVRAEGELLGEAGTEIPTAISAVAARLGSDLLVLSPHHHGILSAWLNPGVSNAVSRSARIPVLLVPDIRER
ncbi:nucleotide-binding universal stress UspA family protein [Catenulispora sp. GP43]|uniref:universal stress protein n=1 Tax=Catenulispora sp. GP43 TaxID=3156263 RepID=UPI0035152AB8